MTHNTSKSIEACAAHYGEHADAMRDYLLEGERKAQQLNNRGPIRFDEHGDLAQDILDAYSQYGFYVFEGIGKLTFGEKRNLVSGLKQQPCSIQRTQ